MFLPDGGCYILPPLCGLLAVGIITLPILRNMLSGARFLILTGILGLGLFTSSFSAAAPQQSTDPITGLWLTQDKDGIINIYTCGQHICGSFYWLEDDGPDHISRDTENRNRSKRGKPLCGMQFMSGFSPDHKNFYSDGAIYSPRDGNTYDAQMTLINHDTLDLHGYVFVPTFGESQTWIRVKSKNSPHCMTGGS
jgi:uncharacterized protein (DUF2147 family)